MVETEAPIKFFEIPDKSESDANDYKYVVLANGLKVLLVSDNLGCNANYVGVSSNLTFKEHAYDKSSAVALMIDVGPFDEPRKFLGLAHLLQHMMFMGSKKNPENSFSKHISKYDCANISYTNREETLYYLNMPKEDLDSGMGYFAAQLKEPLLLLDSMARAREEVESKYQLRVNKDNERRDQLLQSISNENYPHHYFTFGNLKSLKEDIENNQELHENLLEFYKRHYSAHRMFACIQSCLPMQHLEELAIKHFADISSNWLPGHDFSQYNYKQAFKKEFYEEIFLIKSKDVCKLDLTWVLPSTLKLYKCKPSKFLSCILANEGKGSLCAYLRKRLWALQVKADSESNSMFALFSLSIFLTDLGLKHLDEVLEVIFSFIKILNKASDLKEVYQDVSLINNTNFRYAEQNVRDNNVKYLAKCCKYYPPKDILTGDKIYFNFDEDEIQNLLDHLNVFNFNIMLTTQNGYRDEVYDKKERWFGTEYTSQKMPEKWLELWNNCHIIPELHLPQANPFKSQDFHIFWLEDGKQKLNKFPKKIMQTELFELWFRQDDKFLLPYGEIYFYLMSPLLRKNAKNSVLCGLYADLIQHHLTEELYPAKEAGISYRIFSLEKGIAFVVEGPNENLHLVVEILIKALISTKDRITESQWEIIKKQHKTENFDDDLETCYVSSYILDYILNRNEWLVTETYKHVNNVTFSELKLFAEEFTQQLYVQALIQGNFQQETACSVMSTVMEHLNCGEIKEISLMENMSTEIPIGCHKILCHNFIPTDCNSETICYYQIGTHSLRNECIMGLITLMLDTPVKDILVTKQQLGFNFSLSHRINCGNIGYMIDVSYRETNYSAYYMEQCIEEFRQSIQTILNETSLEDFENCKKFLTTIKQIDDCILGEETSRNWGEIVDQEYLFERNIKHVEIIERLEKQDILEFWRKHVSENVRKLIIQVVSFKRTEGDSSIVINKDFSYDLKFMDSDQDGTAIINVQEFKENLHVYPIIKLKKPHAC